MLLDSETCIAILRVRPSHPAERMRAWPPSEIGISGIVQAELLYGARHSPAPAANMRLLQEFLRPLVPVPFDGACAARYGQLREELGRRGQLIGPNDMLIAATALAHEAVLVTHNTREFSRVVSLKIEDWWPPAGP